ncbi:MULTISPECIES: hypothetical protein [unclassified Microcoleus]|uniref:hypothetical protein n=1 Tax=unclassified Microcoleus TaxID=2642155 RepID=UPI002FCFC040
MIPQNHARSLLEKLLDHPHGWEIARMVYGSYPSQELILSDIQRDLQKLKDRVTTLERLHSEDEDRKDKNRGWEYESDFWDNNGLSKADSLEREYSPERLGI